MATPTRRLPLSPPKDRPRGPFRRSFWASPLRGSWLTPILGSAILPPFVVAAVTGFPLPRAPRGRVTREGEPLPADTRRRAEE